MLDSGGGGSTFVGADPLAVSHLAAQADSAAGELSAHRGWVVDALASVAATSRAAGDIDAVVAWARSQVGPLRGRARTILRDDYSMTDRSLVDGILEGKFRNIADAVRQGELLADAYNEAQSEGDLEYLRRVVLGLGDNRDNPFYAAGFFRQLGPNATAILAMDLAPVGGSDGDQGLLRILSEGLGSASRSGWLPHDFAEQMTELDPDWIYDNRDGDRIPMTHVYLHEWTGAVGSLFRYGNFDAGFVVTAARKLVIEPYVGGGYPYLTYGPLDGFEQGPSDPRIDVLSAVARNREAAARLLELEIDLPYEDGTRRAGTILVADHWGWQDDGEMAGRVFEAGMLELHRVSGQPADDPPASVTRLLDDIARQGGLDWSNEAKAHLATVLANEIATVADIAYDLQASRGLTFDEVRLLLKEAAASREGLATLLAGAERFSSHTLVSGLAEGDATAEARQVGSLFGILQLADKDARIADEEERNARQALIWGSIEMAADLGIAGLSVAGVATGGPIGGWFIGKGKSLVIDLLRPDTISRYQQLVDEAQLNTTVAVRNLIGASLWERSSNDEALRRDLAASVDRYLDDHPSAEDFRTASGRLMALDEMTDDQGAAFYEWVQSGSLNDEIGAIADVVEGSWDHIAKSN